MNKIGRNAPCPCGSGLKYKRCCEEKDAVDALIASTGLHEKLEIVLSDIVYESVLTGVWDILGPGDDDNPSREELEDFFEFIYGRPLNRIDLNRVVLPLPREPITGLLKLQEEAAAAPDDQLPLFPEIEPEPPHTAGSDQP